MHLGGGTGFTVKNGGPFRGSDGVAFAILYMMVTLRSTRGLARLSRVRWVQRAAAPGNTGRIVTGARARGVCLRLDLGSAT